MTIRVLLADDHAVLRAGLAMLLNAQSDMEVAGEAGNGAEAVRSVQTTAPDLVVMDLSMGEHSGLEAISKVRSSSVGTKVLVLSMHTDASYVRMALAAGASGYVAKSVADTELLTAIRAVAQGRTFVDLAFEAQAVRSEVMEEYRQESESRPADPIRRLSGREREVLSRVAQGFTNSQIAESLGISVKSIETYRARVLEKLGLRTRAELVRFALGSGLLTSERGVHGA
ncbi:Oxygen regulatory protein NreC [Nitrospira tepida]|uniref:Oxygen regulatory protein NreC n=1 Tax=Nitrospira tepida TaxID=2973512 RepID=A0AA86MYL2_9BACT|nr:response regulator transcription factor [Nitrospira tepida]CAI4031477.1 Oxygen regulatory protein NreC [Nitrospira tepida]